MSALLSQGWLVLDGSQKGPSLQLEPGEKLLPGFNIREGVVGSPETTIQQEPWAGLVADEAHRVFIP